MPSLIARTLPAALVLAFLSAASVAEDRPNTTLVQKSKSSSMAQKSRAQPATAVIGEAAVKAGSKQRAPADASTPTAERSYEGCHGKGAEA